MRVVSVPAMAPMMRELTARPIHPDVMAMPMAVAVMRGLFISAVVLFYILFVVGTLLGKNWARWFGLTAVILNLLLVLSALFQGAAPTQALLWSVIPIILLVYIFSQQGRDTLRSNTTAGD